jgi:ribosomal protein S17E
MPLRFAKWLFAFYTSEFNTNKKILDKLTKEQKVLYWVS